MFVRAAHNQTFATGVDGHVPSLVCACRSDLGRIIANSVSWHLPSTSSAGGRKSWRERVFYDKTWRFRDPGKGKTEVLPAGNYEYPFDVVLEGSMPESVEGLSETWVMYRFKAEIGRKYAKDIVCRKPLRIIRTLDPSALELSHAMVRGVLEW